MILETGILLHAIAFPHIFGFLPIIVGALAGMGTASAVGLGALSIGAGMSIGGLAVGALAGGAVGASGMKAAGAARDQANAANDATARQYWYNVEGWNHSKTVLNAKHEHAVQAAETAQRNEVTLATWKDASAAQNYHHQLQINAATDQASAEQYAKSENIYGYQTTLNSVAAAAGKVDELRKYKEIHTEASFDQQDASLQAMLDEGKLRARGIEGRSIGKATQATLADYGRQMSLLSESLSSAGRNTRAALQQIERDHFTANLTAYANRMLRPAKSIAPPIPYATPIAEFDMPRPLTEADYGAYPVMGATVNPNAAASGVWGQLGMGIASSAIGAGIGNLFKGSDVGLKENLEYIEKSPSGINIYEWNYKGEDQRYRGVIAQDLIAQGRLDAIAEADNGYLAVDYSKLDVQMIPV